MLGRLSWERQHYLRLANLNPDILACSLPHETYNSSNSCSGTGHKTGIRQSGVNAWVANNMDTNAHRIFGHGIGRLSRRVDFDSIVKNKQTNRSPDCVVPVCDRVYDGFSESLLRKLWSRFRFKANNFMGRPQVEIEEAFGLVDHIQETSL